MSGYRTLHRFKTPENENPSQEPSPIWRVRLSPCRCFQDSPSTPSSSSTPALRLLAAGATNSIRAYSLLERTNNENDILDASAMSVTCTECLVSSDYHHIENNETRVTRDRSTLGYAALDIARNYVGSDILAGDEIVVASQLGGKVGVWIRLDPASGRKKEKKDVGNGDFEAENGDGEERMKYIRPDAEFEVGSATGTTIAIRPPSLGNYYAKKENDVLVALGCTNGQVVICRTGILAASTGTGVGGSSRVVGDTSASSSDEAAVILSGSTPGEIVANVGGGHACVMSLIFHPSIPNTFVVGRKDGTIDIYSSHNHDDYYYSHEGDLAFRRMHRLVHSSYPIRALGYSHPDGALLFAGDDDGRLYSYDASVASSAVTSGSTQTSLSTAMSAPVKLVACALTAHKGWVMNLSPFPDGRRVATCGSDGSVRVWDCGMGLASSTPLHSFDGLHSGWIWDVDCGFINSCKSDGIGSGRMKGGEQIKLVSCGNHGVMQIVSCGE